jgi:hypothetical protein
MLTHDRLGFQTYCAITERSSLSTASDNSNVLSHNPSISCYLRYFSNKLMTRRMKSSWCARSAIP